MGRGYIFLLLNLVKYLEKQSEFWVIPLAPFPISGRLAKAGYQPEHIRCPLWGRIPRVKTKGFLVGPRNEYHINILFLFVISDQDLFSP